MIVTVLQRSSYVLILANRSKLHKPWCLNDPESHRDDTLVVENDRRARCSVFVTKLLSVKYLNDFNKGHSFMEKKGA